MIDLKKAIAIGLTALLLLLLLCGCNNSTENTKGLAEQLNTLGEPPALQVSLNAESSPEQRISATRLSWTWSVPQGDGTTVTTHTDACGALQLADYSEITLFINDDNAEINFSFNDDYLPQSISARCWDVKFLEMESDGGFWDEGEPLEVIGNNKLNARNDGIDYIYEIYASWEMGNSCYVFRVNMVRE